MSAGTIQPGGAGSSAPPRGLTAASLWIISPAIDQLLILATPLLAIPAMFFLHAPLGIQAETISLVVTSFFALGHHLPGMIRAYGDRELFERFRWRFMLAPAILFSAHFPLAKFHPDFIPLVIVFWATWHGLMQLFGFVRIYDAKVGSRDALTAWLDWLVCLVGFTTVQLHSPQRLANLLQHWYGLGLPWLSAEFVASVRQVSLLLTVTCLIAFFANYLYRSFRGPRPSSVKLLLLVSGIGTWWFAVDFIDNVVLGAALFDVCHDVQYLAIVWIYNCRRVSSDPSIGRFMSYVFRRGMVAIYVALIVAYGAIGIIPSFIEDGRLAGFITALVGTSTLLHYYYDGFIWKVREPSTQAGLGLAPGSGISGRPTFSAGGFTHLMKWSPLILMAIWLLVQNLTTPTLVAAPRQEELRENYEKSLQGNTSLPKSEFERVWLLKEFERVQRLAQSVPDDRNSQLRAAVMLANFGRNDEAVAVIRDQLQKYPQFSRAHLSLGEIHRYRGNTDLAMQSFVSALQTASNNQERAAACLNMGQLHAAMGEASQARARFEEAMRFDPELAKAVRSRQLNR